MPPSQLYEPTNWQLVMVGILLSLSPDTTKSFAVSSFRDFPTGGDGVLGCANAGALLNRSILQEPWPRPRPR